MQTIQAQQYLSDSELEDLNGEYLGKFLDERHYDVVVTESTKVLKPDGTILLVYVKDALPRKLCETTFEVMKKVPVMQAGDRGIAAGLLTDPNDERIDRTYGEPKSVTGARYYRRKEDGTYSNQSIAVPVNSGIIGYFDRSGRQPYCRQTSFNADKAELFEQARPFFCKVSEVFKEQVPERYQAQADYVAKIHPDFVIPETVFTTITVNRNFRTACHFDKGDYQPGFGVMAVLQSGEYGGGYLIFPQYRVALDMRTGGLAMADVHCAHGNSAMVGKPNEWIRYSLVLYCRVGMLECKSQIEEVERAKLWADKIAIRHSSKMEKLF